MQRIGHSIDEIETCNNQSSLLYRQSAHSVGVESSHICVRDALRDEGQFLGEVEKGAKS